MLNLGDCLFSQADVDGASHWFARAVENDPTNPVGLNGLGLCHQVRADHAAAVRSFETALTRDAQYPEALGNLAVSLQCLGRHEDALEVGRRAVEAAPQDANAILNLGHIFQSLGRHAEAVETYQQALSIDPTLPSARAYLLHSRRHICEWDGDAELVAKVIHDVQAGAQVPPFALAGTIADPETRLIAARRSAAAHQLHSARAAPEAKPAKTSLRVGFVSPDFRTHSLAMSFSSVLAARHDPDIEWVGYSVATGDADRQTGDLAAAFDQMTDLDGLTAAAASSRIRSDGIDVLVDLAGHTRGGRLDIFAHQPAPVQAHYLGYGSTVGADYIPWLITDRTHTPPNLAPYCSEALVYLPDTFMAAERIAIPNGTATRAQEGLPESGTVFASFNATYKLDPEAFAVWMTILKAVPNSVLWLRGANESIQSRLGATATNHGVDPERLVFAARRDRLVHLARHQLADISLDAFGHAGGVTTLDSLLAGVPVLTVAGASQSARTGASILEALGTPEWIHDDVAAYEAAAIALGRAPHKISDAKRTLQKQIDDAALFDAPRLAAHLNTAFRTMYDMAATGAPPTSFDVVSETA
jgi:predicted O-linked N-acetylglucosamine transferase (SPINDLY family)